jgi:ribosomal protein L24
MVGKDKDKQGTVLRVVRDQRFPRVFVQGLNMVRHAYYDELESTT